MSHDYVLTNGAEISHFRIESRLGAGGMGEVYKVHDLTLDRAAAMKVLSPEYLTDGDRVRRFVLEAKSASALNHPNIVTIYEIGQVPVSETSLGLEGEGEVAIHFIAMEYIDGLTLRALASKGTETKKLLEVMAQVAEGLTKAHGEGIVHRDLKPDNIMITNDGYAKIVDFGLAKLTESKGRADQHRTASGVVMGTAAYMSPEQVQGLDIDQRSDIFSYGAILYELICGRRPFQSDSSIDTMHKIVFSEHPSLQDIAPWLPESLRLIIDRCLEKEPDDRYAGAREIAVDLRQAIRQFEAGTIAPSDPTVAMQAGVATPPPQAPASGGQSAPASHPPAPQQAAPQQAAPVSQPLSGGYPGSGAVPVSGGVAAHQGSGPMSSPSARFRRRRRINLFSIIYRLVMVVLVVLAGYLWYVWPDFAPVETLPLEDTPTIAAAKEEGPVVWEWLPHDRISPALRRSVVEEMDPDFFSSAIGTKPGNEALSRAVKGGKVSRIPTRIVGMSAISRGAVAWGMLNPGNPLRTLEASAFSVGLERRISREDTLEILLNTAEFEAGIFGVEAAAKAYFKKSARSLSPEEAAILAIAIHYPSETNIREPDNLAIARRDKLIKALDAKKAAGQSSSGKAADPSSGQDGANSSDTTESADDEGPAEAEPLPEGSELPNVE